MRKTLHIGQICAQLFLAVLFNANISFAQSDRYWSGNGSNDNIDQGSNWFGNINPNAGDNLYFNNTQGRHWAYSNYGSGSYFGSIITYDGAGGIKFYGDNLYAYKFENYSDNNLLELGPSSAAIGSREIGNRQGFNIEINPVGSGGILVSCDRIAIDNTGGSRELKIYGNNLLTINGSIVERNGTGAKVSLLGSATVIIKGNSSYSGITTISAGTLEIQGDLASSTITIASGAKLRINGDNVDINALIIEEGGVLEILPGKSLTVTGTLTNYAGNSGIVIKSNASGTGSLKHSTAGVAATVERYIPGESNDWHLISSPVVAQPISGGNFADAGGYDFYMWQESGSLWVNYKNQSGGSGSAPFFDIMNGSNNFNPGQGYLVAYVAPNTNAKSFTGNLNNGDVPVVLKYAGTGEYAGSNFLGNPYPSAIDWYSADKAQFSNNFAAVYNPLKSGGAGFENIDGASDNAHIAAGQGFFVASKLSSNGQTFNFTNAIREHGGTFYKIDPLVDKIELQLGNDEFYDETVIRLKEATLVAQDRDDAPKYFSYDVRVPQLYSLSQDQAKLAINSIPSIEETPSVLLGYSIPSDGDYFIRLSAMSGQMEQQGAYLEDLLTGVKVNLRDQNTYSFSAQKDGDPVRFKLTFSTVGIDENNLDNFVVYAHGKDIYISNTPSNAQINLSTLTGQVVMQRNTGGSGLVTLNAASLPKGVYIVTVQGEGARVSRKVVL